MQAGEGTKEAAIDGCGEGHSRVAEQDREQGGEGGPEDEDGRDLRRSHSVETLNKVGHDVCRWDGVTPGNYADDRDVHGQVQESDCRDREQDGARNDSFRLAYFARKETDVVIAAIVVHGDQGGAAQSEEKCA